jgi:CheY-like chemotaxis protein
MRLRGCLSQRFKLRDPVHASEAAPEPSTAAPPTQPARTNCAGLATILVVDDNDAAIELAHIMLVQNSDLRCNMLCASSGEEALSLLHDLAAKGESIDVMLLDVNMPRMDGFQVLERVASDMGLPKPAILMCSTSSYERDVQRARALGASGYVEKPPHLAKLRPVLDDLPGVRLEEDERGAALLRVA